MAVHRGIPAADKADLSIQHSRHIHCDRPVHHGTIPDMWGMNFESKILNAAVTHFGPLLPAAVLIAQLFMLPFDKLKRQQILPDSPSLPDALKGHEWLHSWPVACVVFWVMLLILRLALYLPVVFCKGNYYFSDHIFLISSLVAQVQMSLYVAHRSYSECEQQAEKIGAVVALTLGWLLILLLIVESFVTAVYYHTVRATWVAFFSGWFLFGGLARWWIEKMRPDSNKREVLLKA